MAQRTDRPPAIFWSHVPANIKAAFLFVPIVSAVFTAGIEYELIQSRIGQDEERITAIEQDRKAVLQQDREWQRSTDNKVTETQTDVSWIRYQMEHQK